MSKAPVQQPGAPTPRAAKVVMPTAALEPRDGDIALPDELFLKLSLFQQLKQKPSIDKYPGSLALRHYQPGEVICRQGEAGWTAFFILARTDLELLRDYPRARLADAPREKLTWEEKRTKATTDKERREADDALARLDAELDYLPRLVANLQAALHVPPADSDPQAEVARVRLTLADEQKPTTSWLSRLGQGIFGGRGSTLGETPAYIPVDNGVLISSKTREASLTAGQLFGEMSCLYRTPRSATVVATQECYLVEMLRNLFDQMQKDPAYRERTAKMYRERTLALVVSESPLFRGLNEVQAAELRAQAELVDFEPGTLIGDEHERSDCLYLIRSGVVKVVKNVSALLGVKDVVDANRLCAELHAGSDPQSGARHALWQRLPAPLCTSLANGDASHSPQELVHALNDLIREPAFLDNPTLREMVVVQKLGVRVWAQQATPHRQTAADLCLANRTILSCIFAGQIQDASTADVLIRPPDVRDWKAFLGALYGGDKKPGDARRLVWELLPPALHALVTETRTAPNAKAQEEVLAALNGVLTEAFLLLRPAFHELALGEQPASKNIRARILPFLPERERWTDYTFQQGLRLVHRLVLEALCPQGLRPRQASAGPELVLAYRSLGESLGEIGLIENQPRSATLVAYNHPEDDPEREVGPVQVIRISAELFHKLRQDSPGFAKIVEATRQAYRAHTSRRLEDPLGVTASPLVQSERAEELGLIQGQKLMLIDLERCTRCDECVQACVNTHDDGRTRLFLDGPRFGKYLVPMTCRSCLDPVCMIGCPVGSIHRGDNRQIVIENWCIGCGLCATQCPYDAIQMHDLGIIPQSAYGWRYQLAERVGDAKWFTAGYRDRAWPTGKSPFHADRALREPLRISAPLPAEASLCFRHEFRIEAAVWKKPGQFALELESPAAKVQAWLNGRVIEPSETKRGTRTYTLEDAASVLRPGRNLLAVQVEPVPAEGEILKARLDRLEQPRGGQWGDRTAQKAVTERAVVCDLCSSLPGGPACVSSCPHDAALRVNARLEFPTR